MSTSGAYKGKTVDFMLTADSLAQAAKINKFFEKNAPSFSIQLEAHLKKADLDPIDTNPNGGAAASGYRDTLPDGSTVFKEDQAALQALQNAGSPQRTSIIIPVQRSDGLTPPPFRFSVESENLDYVISNGRIVRKR